VYVHLVDAPAETEEEARKRIIEPFEKHIRGIAK
jgi:multisubunit Na+/H+ antiporter MnhE subunit